MNLDRILTAALLATMLAGAIFGYKRPAPTVTWHFVASEFTIHPAPLALIGASK